MVEKPELHSRQSLRGAGYSNVEVRQLLRVGELTPVRRGTYLRGSSPDDGRARHVVAARAAVDCLADGAVCSHVTAAVLHGLPVWRIPLQRVHVTRARRTGGRRGARIHVHSAPLNPDEIDMIAGIPVTGLARTLVDLARTVPFEEAVAVADAALRVDDAGWRSDDAGWRSGDAGWGRTEVRPDRRPLDTAALAAALARAAKWRGAPTARRALAFADGRSASVGESRSRVALHRAGLPVPVLQWEVRGVDGRLVGYTDFGWPELCTVGEFDGRVKYGRLLRPGQEPGDAVFEEKLREDRLRDLGLAVIRWTWADLANFTPVAARLDHHLAP